VNLIEYQVALLEPVQFLAGKAVIKEESRALMGQLAW
jgi:hypothetical protein